MTKLHLQKCTTLLLSLVLCLALVGCNTTKNEPTLDAGADTPEEALDGYLNGYFTHDETMVLSYSTPIFPGHFETLNVSDNSSMNKGVLAVIKVFAQNHYYELVEINMLSEKEAEATILLTYYDASPYLIQQTLLYEKSAENITVTGLGEFLYDNVDTNLILANYQMKTTQTTIYLKCIDGKWFTSNFGSDSYNLLQCNILAYSAWLKEHFN